jgi:glycosyltransferase involved in cell wall biosynthesis
LVSLHFKFNDVYTLKAKAIKVLIVCSGNFDNPKENFHLQQSFVYEQMKALNKLNVNFNVFLIQGSGILGYMKNIFKYHKMILSFQPDLIHAHFGLSGLFANLQFLKPVVTTFHGSDVQTTKKNLYISKIASYLSKFSISVNRKMVYLLNINSNYSVIPCGVEKYEQEMSVQDARSFFGFSQNENLILFASAFDNSIKNYALAKKTLELVPNAKLIELKGYDRNEVLLLMKAVDCLLMTSLSEGSPQVVKEAMMMGCPIVSVDVGDVCDLIKDIEGCFLVSYDAKFIADKLNKVLENKKRINGYEKLEQMQLFNHQVSKRILEVYQNILQK